MLKWALLFIALLLATACGGRADAADEKQAARDIAAQCGNDTACVERQQSALKHYLGIWVWFNATAAQAETCARAGKTGKHVDWTKAEACMRSWSKGRPGPFAAGGKPKG